MFCLLNRSIDLKTNEQANKHMIHVLLLQAIALAVVLNLYFLSYAFLLVVVVVALFILS